MRQEGQTFLAINYNYHKFFMIKILVKKQKDCQKGLSLLAIFPSYFSTIKAFGKYLSPIGVDVLFTTFPS